MPRINSLYYEFILSGADERDMVSVNSFAVADKADCQLPHNALLINNYSAFGSFISGYVCRVKSAEAFLNLLLNINYIYRILCLINPDNLIQDTEEISKLTKKMISGYTLDAYRNDGCRICT